MNANKSKRCGVCALTGEEGDFIDCHIIPAALSQTARRGEPLTQIGRAGWPIRRWTSWYDERLVTQKGEDILQKYDDEAIKIFRRQRLIWSSWGPMLRLSTSMYTPIGNTGHGMREISLDAAVLRMFFLSVLWRGLSTSLWEFEGIRLPPKETEKLRRMVLHNDPRPFDFLSISLMQFTSQTTPFNHSIVLHKKTIPYEKDGELCFDEGRQIDCFRIYFDGLIANININLPCEYFSETSGLYLAEADTTIVQTMQSNRSAYISRINFDRGAPVPSDHLDSLIREVYGDRSIFDSSANEP